MSSCEVPVKEEDVSYRASRKVIQSYHASCTGLSSSHAENNDKDSKGSERGEKMLVKYKIHVFERKQE